jgi:hypothetical protein
MAGFESLWEQALPFDEFVAGSTEHRALWAGLHRLARLPDWALAAAAGAPRRRLLVLAEDWCGDASNTIPILARWAEHAASLELRILRRDEHPEVMDRYLTDGSRSIPIVIALDEAHRELGHWGPRPRALQEWVLAHRRTIPKAELYPWIRRWYARDRGESTLREVAAAAGIAIPEPEGRQVA